MGFTFYILIFSSEITANIVSTKADREITPEVI